MSSLVSVKSVHTDGKTDGQTTDNRRSEKLNWAFSSGELKCVEPRGVLHDSENPGQPIAFQHVFPQPFEQHFWVGKHFLSPTQPIAHVPSSGIGGQLPFRTTIYKKSVRLRPNNLHFLVYVACKHNYIARWHNYVACRHNHVACRGQKYATLETCWVAFVGVNFVQQTYKWHQFSYTWLKKTPRCHWLTQLVSTPV